MKKIIVAIIILLMSVSVKTIAQSADSTRHSDTYQIKLQEKVKCIQNIEYDKTGEKLKGILSEDGTIIYLPDYKVNNKLRLNVILENGQAAEIYRSPCSVELSEKIYL